MGDALAKNSTPLEYGPVVTQLSYYVCLSAYLILYNNVSELRNFDVGITQNCGEFIIPRHRFIVNINNLQMTNRPFNDF